MKKFWDFIKNENGVPELLLYGTISENSWWGDNVSPKRFKEELDNLGNVDEIVVRIYSGGGDVFAANAIYAMLKDYPAKITVKIDGLAASAATIVAMAGDEILMAKNAYFMIHLPSMSTYGNEEEVEKALEILKSVKENIINTYEQRTKLDRTELENMMKEEKWMKSDEALEKGFIDGILYNEDTNKVENNANIDKIQIYNDLSKLKNMPLKFKSWNNNMTQNIKNDKEGENFMNANELKTKNPALYNEIYNLGVSAERERIKNLDEIANTVDGDLIQKAKYEDFKNANEVSLEAIKNNKLINNSYLNAIANDAMIVNNVVGANTDAQPAETKSVEIANDLKKVTEIANKIMKR